MDTNEFMLVRSRRKHAGEKRKKKERNGRDERLLGGIETIQASHEIKLN